MENETNIDLKPRERKFCEEYLILGKKEASGDCRRDIPKKAHGTRQQGCEKR